MNKLEQRSFANFADFWPHYVLAHRAKSTYLMHATGVVLGILFAFGCLLSQSYVWIPGGLPIAYGFAIPSHFLFEGNRPASAYAPLYSLLGDLKLTYVVIRGDFPELVQKYEHSHNIASLAKRQR